MKKRKATTIRLDPELRPRVDRFARITRRSMNAAVNVLVDQALDLLEPAYPDPDPDTKAA